MSLIIGLYAIRLAQKSASDSSYTYGWQRAEVLGALANSVFLLALCFTIYVESLQRFFQVERIKNPFMVLYVGSAGLAINLIGLVLFHGMCFG